MDNFEKFDNGTAVLKNKDGFYVLVGDEKLEISECAYELIRKNPDCAFDIIIDAKRKFWFNTAMDRYSPLEY